MIKSYTKDEFNELLSSALMSVMDDSTGHVSPNASTAIMVTGILVISEIRKKIFEDNPDMITIEKE